MYPRLGTPVLKVIFGVFFITKWQHWFQLGSNSFLKVFVGKFQLGSGSYFVTNSMIFR